MSTADTLHLRPGPGLVVIDPATRKRLPAEGAAVPMGEHATYWHRRLADGDVVTFEPAPPADAAAADDKPTSRRPALKPVQTAPE